ncbi:calmodulin-dependent protein kinase [Aureococcus anophagefferens]|nr:calmodulin-dependent protein kinase [Aureococcus anophagefferens]
MLTEITNGGDRAKPRPKRRAAAVAAADADVQQPPAKEGRRCDDPSRRGVTAASLARLSALMLAAFYVVVDELGIPREEVSIPRASEVIAAAAVMAMNYDPKSGNKKGDGHTRKTNPCAGFQLKGLFTALYKVHTINAQAATAAAAAVVVIDRIPVVLAVKACQAAGGPDKLLVQRYGADNLNRLLEAYDAYLVALLNENEFARGSRPAFFSVGAEQPAFAKRILVKLGAPSGLLLGHFLHPDAFLRAFGLKKPADIDKLMKNPLAEKYKTFNATEALYVDSDLAVDAFMGHLKLATSGPSSLYSGCYRRLGPAFKVLGAARSARSRRSGRAMTRPAGRRAPPGPPRVARPFVAFATATSQAQAADKYKWGDASVDGRAKARAGAKADGKFSNFKYATPAEAAAAKRATSAARDARVQSDGRACYLPGGCDGSSGGCEIPEGYKGRPALVKMLKQCETCRRRAKVILEAPDPRSPDLIPAAEKSPGPWFFTALSLAKAANDCPVMGQYNESRCKSAATLARDKRRLEGKEVARLPVEVEVEVVVFLYFSKKSNFDKPSRSFSKRSNFDAGWHPATVAIHGDAWDVPTLSNMSFVSFPAAGAAQQQQASAQAQKELAKDADVRDIEIANARLLDAIASGDYLTYSCLVSDDLTCFEPEGCGHLVQGIDFHKYYFDLARADDAAPRKKNTTMVDPHTRVVGDVAVVAYVRLVQDGFRTTRCEETRVWRRMPAGDSALSKWQLVHFHRSAPANGHN